ncbi:MAG: HIT family protein [Chloroflexota bacterium]|nr:HIT family protein [Chloroflexota bacterium]
MSCPLCHRIAEEDIIIKDRLAFAIADAFPLTPGHSLVVPRRHEPDFFALSTEERSAMLALAVELRSVLSDQYGFQDLNLGLNNGPAAGQTVPHAHLHVIPRYEGDSPDPRGGVRWMFPDRAAYWKM